MSLQMYAQYMCVIFNIPSTNMYITNYDCFRDMNKGFVEPNLVLHVHMDEVLLPL